MNHPEAEDLSALRADINAALLDGEKDMPPAGSELTLREKLGTDWSFEIDVASDEGSEEFLEWSAGSHCGIEIQKIAALADAVALQWPDQAAQVRACAIDQMQVVAHG